jgi:hypothetical protein
MLFIIFIKIIIMFTIINSNEENVSFYKGGGVRLVC